MRCFAFIFVCLFPQFSALGAAKADITISNVAGPWPIVIKTCSHDAGAICSLTWRNKEFIDDHDHGRQLQSAASFDYLGEAFNPTEAGSRVDGINPSPSSSILQGSWSTPNILATQTKMAFWDPINGVNTSEHILNKRVTIGIHGLAHVIEYATQFTVPAAESHFHGVFEVLTGYMPSEFSQFWTYQPDKKILTPLTDNPGEQSLPIIFSTPDGKWAMGIYSPETPQAGWPRAGYGRWRFTQDHVVKWNNVYRIADPKGVYHFRSYVIVGSLENVHVSMSQLYHLVHK